MAKTPSLDKETRVPKLGDTVLYLDPSMGDVYPAMVVKVLSDGRALLTAFQPGTTPFPVRMAVEQDLTKTKKGTWHFKDG